MEQLCPPARRVLRPDASYGWTRVPQYDEFVLVLISGICDHVEIWLAEVPFAYFSQG